MEICTRVIINPPFWGTTPDPRLHTPALFDRITTGVYKEDRQYNITATKFNIIVIIRAYDSRGIPRVSVTMNSSDDDFKSTAIQKEDVESPTRAIYDEIEEKKLIRKIDWKLLPILGALYSISFIDRGNVRCLLARASTERYADDS